MNRVSPKALIENGVQYGHQVWRWCPKMRPFIWGQKNGIHLINVATTAAMIEKAAQFLESVAAEGKVILWVGTKRPAQKVIAELGKETNSPIVTHRWVGGTLTNFQHVRKSVTKLLHLEDVLAKSQSADTLYTKKELSIFQKMIDRLEKNVGGIRKLSWPVGAVVLVDVKKEHVALKEARAAGIPVVALVDTNCDPSDIDYVIPSNDDVPRAINVVMGYLAEAVKRGQAVAQTKPQEEVRGDHMIQELLAQALRADLEEETAAKPKRGRSAGAGSAHKGGAKKSAYKAAPRARRAPEATEEKAEATEEVTVVAE